MKNGFTRITTFLLGFIFLLGVSPAAAGSAPAANALAWPQVSLVRVADDLTAPVYLTHAGDGSGRIFIVEQIGRIRILKGGLLLPDPFLDLTVNDRVLFDGEQGLLGLAFPPQYAEKGYFYVYYTNQDGNNQVSRFSITDDADRADAGSEDLILPLSHPNHENHNGGQLAFGPDGYLYISTGDGGGSGDPGENAQDLASPLGKILRIDTESNLNDYQIPPTNPFAGRPGARGEIWALGLRNPWRFSFDRQTGDLFIGDVGQGSLEEIDFQPASIPGGENYGWDWMEGSSCFQTGCNPDDFTLPVFEYQTHEQGTCAVTGGFVYRGLAETGLQGIYFLGDYCNGKIWGLRQDGGEWQNQELADTDLRISGFGEDQEGELYVLNLRGEVYRLASPFDHFRFLPLVNRSP